MPSLFLCHGAPTLVLEENGYTSFLKNLGASLTPEAIVVFTAHWETKTTTVSSRGDTYPMIYDFSGFPRELHSIRYPATGSAALADRVQALLTKAGIGSRSDRERGLDHGSWSVLTLMFPEADIPVVQVSINPFLPMEQQYGIGKALRDLDRENILILGSGSTVHNLSTIDWDADQPEPWAMEFDDWLLEKILRKDPDSLFRYRQLAPQASRAIPREEHIAPLFIAMGSGSLKTPVLHYRSYAYGTLSYICLEF